MNRRHQPDRQHRRSSSTGPRSSPSRVSAARLVAYDVLRDVDERDAYANLALPARIREARLDPRDAGLATELVAGTLRGQGRYDRIIELASGRTLDHIDERTRRVLRLGAHQLLSMRTAAHAAVNESVELQRRVANQAAAGFVNGVLREIGRSTNDEWNDRIAATAVTADDALAGISSHPAWVLRAMRASLQAEGRSNELEALLSADNVPPKVNLVVLPYAGGDTPKLNDQQEESGVQATGPSPLGFVLEGGDPARVMHALHLPPGVLRVQDQGSQLAALALSRATPVSEAEQWLDLCAGPGGKTAVLASEAAKLGAHLRANEVSQHRTELVRESVAAHAGVVDVVTFDGRDDAAFAGASFDRILVDAPCSGLGALRRRPEARWRKHPSDLPRLTQLQGQLLDAAAEHLVEGGVLAYVTCSPHLAETRVVLDAFLKRHAEMQEIDAKSVVQSIAREPLDLAGDHLSAQLWPHRHGTDAMFIALMTRTSTASTV